MKKISKLRLNQLSEIKLQDREMNELRGGEWCCSCSCYWAGNGGSSSNDNSKANYNSHDQNYSNQGSNCYNYCCNDTYTNCGMFYLTGN